MSKVGIILTPDIRSNAYLSKIIDKKIKIGEIIFLDDSRKDRKFHKNVINESADILNTQLESTMIDNIVKIIHKSDNALLNELSTIDKNDQAEFESMAMPFMDQLYRC